MIAPNYEPYIVQQGDYLLALAARFGFEATEVWNHATNAKLKAQRPDPNILAPMDVLYFPRAPKAWLPVTVGGTNAFTAKVAMADVQVEFGAYGHPWKDEPYTVEGADVPPGKLTAAGLLSVKVPIHVKTLIVSFPRIQRRRVIHIGHLDPADTASGIRQRLEQRGYLTNHFDRDDEANFKIAVMRLQTANKRAATGVLDKDTLKLLTDEHSC